jgi:hypothetical protein
MTVYLLHFEEPIGNPSTPHGMAQHYIGWSPEPAARIARHASGDGAKIIRYVMEAGIGFVVAQTWEGGPDLEKRLKRRHDAPRVCPVCIEERREQRERDELLAQMDWERELAEAMQRAEAKVTGHEAGDHQETVPGCFPCFLRAAGRGPFSPAAVEAEEAAETR